MGVPALLGGDSPVTAPQLLALQPGVTQAVSLAGDDLANVRVWSSLVSLSAAPLKEGTPGNRWGLELPAATGLGLGVLRFDLPTSQGAYQVVLVDPLPTLPDRAGERVGDRDHPLPLRPGTAVEGKLEGAAVHHFQIDLSAGETIHLETVAKRLGQPIDGQLRVFDSSGHDLARADDSAITGQDPWLAFTAPRRDTYRIELSDARQPPEARRRYRLRATSAAPSPLTWLPSAHPFPDSSDALPVKTVGGSEGQSGLVIDAFPVELQGIDRPRGSRDVFEFSAIRDQRLRIDLLDRRMGSAGDFTARIESLPGRILAETDLAKADLATVAWTVPADGRYRVILEEITGAGGPGYDYRARVRLGGSDFLLQLNEHLIEFAPDALVEVRVKVQRRGYDGPIQLSVHGLPATAEIEGREISAKSNEATLKLKLPAGIPVGTRFALTVTGAVETSGLRYETRADTRTALRKLFPEFNEPPPFLDGWLWLSLVEKKSGK